ncbi:glycosyltransferase family 4 protein, partial [Candidatus Parcubacteria bacterium]|nr:glycosyltransferase family 4 protein [Candidatus Parcubacteria bacterium]
MRIGIDARFYGPGGRGIGRYTAELVRHLEAGSTPADEFLIFLRRDNYDAYRPERPNFRKVLADFPWYSIVEQTRFPALIRKARVDLVHFLHFNVPMFSRTPYVVTIHDLILKRYPTIAASTRAWPTYLFKRLGYHAVIRGAVRRARAVIAVSRFTRSQIVSAWPRVADRIVVIPEGVSVLARATEPPGAVLQRYAIARPYFLYVGSCYPHKNVSGLVAAYRVLQGMEPAAPDLVLVGSRDRFSERLAESVRAAGIHGVHFVGFVPDSDLQALYEAAVAYVCP